MLVSNIEMQQEPWIS